MEEKNPELVQEFKTAATAMTKLFKLASSNMKNYYEQGYTDALRHLLDQLDVDSETNVQSWAVQQLTGITQADSEMFSYDNEMDDGSTPGEKRAHQGNWKMKRQRNDSDMAP